LEQPTTLPLILGLALTSLYVLSLGYLFAPNRAIELRKRSLPWVTFGLFALASAALCALGRRPYLPSRQALESRYSTVSVFLIVSLVGLLVLIGRDLRDSGQRRAKALSFAIVGIAALVAGYVVNLPFCFEQMRDLRSYHL